MRQDHPDTLVLKRFFGVPPWRVWQAWTNPDQVKLWFGSDPRGTVSAARIELHIGGEFEISFANSDGTGFTCRGKYVRVEPYRCLSFTWGWEGSPEIQELISIELKRTNDGTEMFFRHTHIKGSTIHDYEPGWTTTFDKLTKVLVGGTS